MARAEAESGHADIEQWVGDLKLEVHRLNWFLEHESLENTFAKPGIFGSKESAHGAPHVGSATDDPDGHHSALHSRGTKFGSKLPHP
jgi:hypothetical protein